MSGNSIDVIGTSWCGHTTHMKKVLDDASMHYNFVDDATAKVDGVSAYPTLRCNKADGTTAMHTGEMKLDDLKTWCPLSAST